MHIYVYIILSIHVQTYIYTSIHTYILLVRFLRRSLPQTHHFILISVYSMLFPSLCRVLFYTHIMINGGAKEVCALGPTKTLRSHLHEEAKSKNTRFCTGLKRPPYNPTTSTQSAVGHIHTLSRTDAAMEVLHDFVRVLGFYTQDLQMRRVLYLSLGNAVRTQESHGALFRSDFLGLSSY